MSNETKVAELELRKGIIAELKGISGAKFDETLSTKKLAKVLEKLKTGTVSGVSAKGTPTNSEANKKAGKFLIWLKSRAYVSDTKRVNAGVYAVNEVPARLAKLPSSVFEVLDKEVNSRKIALIGRWAGINPDGVSDEEILAKVISPELVEF